MAIKLIITLVLCLQAFTLYSQHGTLIIASIRPDGILIAADSRGSMYKNNDSHTPPIAYTDSLCKIYPFKQFVIAIAGAYELGNKFIYQIVDDFNKNSFYDKSLDNTIKAFEAFMDENYPVGLFPLRQLMVGIAAGYVNGRPQLSFTSVIRDSTMYEGTMSNDTAVYKYIKANNNKNAGLTVGEVTENIFKDFIIGERKSNQVGGPITIFLINSLNQIGWAQNDFRSYEYTDVKSYIKDLKSGKKKVVYLTPTAKEIILKNF